MIESHLNYLIQIGDNDQGYVGYNSLGWANYVLTNKIKLDQQLDKRFNRDDLFQYCKDPRKENLNVLIAILSWGGMRRDHGKLLFTNIQPLLSLVEKLRKGIYQSRKETFSAIQEVRTIGSLPGLGIGYYTKLICFLTPELRGYIMDQWVSKSINLLTGENVVKISGNNWVNDYNDSTTYELFCKHIDALALKLNCSGFNAEKRIFSVGRGKGEWRKYLIKKYTNKYFSENYLSLFFIASIIFSCIM